MLSKDIEKIDKIESVANAFARVAASGVDERVQRRVGHPAASSATEES
jgi:hypothetical protein